MLSIQSLKAILALLNSQNEETTTAEIINPMKTTNNESRDISEEQKINLFKAILNVSEQSTHSESVVAHAFLQISKQNESIRRVVFLFMSSLDKTTWDWRHEPRQDCISDNSSEHLLMQICVLVRSHFTDRFNACVSQLDMSEHLKRCHTTALLNMAQYVLPPSEIFRIYRNAWKNCFLQYIEQCFGDAVNRKEVKHLVGIYQKLSSQSIVQISEHVSVFQRHRMKHSLQFFHDLRILYCDILHRELENTLEEFKSMLCDLDGTMCASRSAFCLGSVDSSQPSCSSHHTSYSKNSGDSLVLDEDSNRQSHTYSRLLVDLVLKLMKACCDVEQHFKWCYENLSCSILGISQSDDENLEDGVSQNFWEWRSQFTPFVGEIINAMNLNICVNSLTALESEWEKLQLNEAIETVQVPLGQFSCIASSSIAALCTAVQNFGRIVENCTGPLAPIRTSFIDCIAQQCIEIQNHVLKISRFSDSQHVITPALYTLMGSIFALKESLLKCNKISSVKSELQPVFFKIDSLLEVLSDQVLDYHQNALSTSLLHDDESNNWACNRPFYEDEHCSFCIQMWYLHLKTLKNDLWMHLPSPSSQVLFAKTLKHSLEILANRYAGISPSVARVPQMLVDITAILLCATELLPYTAPNLSAFLGVDHEYKHILLSIHNSCSALLAAAIIVTAPLKNVYKVYKKGYPVCQLNGEGDCTRWLAVIQPNRWKGIGSSIDLDTGHWLAINLRIFLNQPVINCCTLIQLLVVRDGSLSKLLLAHPSVVGAFTDCCESKPLEPGFKAADLCSTSSELKSLTSYLHSASDSCCLTLMHLLAHCNSVNKCFADVFIHFLGSNWQCYFDKFSPSMELQVPHWLRILMDILQPLLQLMTESLMCYLLENGDLIEPFMSDVGSLINEVAPKTGVKLLLPNENELVIDALLHLLSTLKTNFLQIPEPLLVFFESLNQASDDDDVKPLNHIGFKLVLAALDAHISSWVFENLEESTKKYAHISTLVCRTIRYLCNSNARGLIPSELIVLMRNHHLKIQDIITHIDEFTHHMLINNFSDTVASSLDSELGNPAYLLASDVACVLSTVKGQQAVKNIYGFLAANRLWIEHNLGVKDDLCWEISANVDPMSENLQEAKAKCLNNSSKNPSNPLKECCKIGDTGFTFARDSLKKVGWNFDHLLQEDFGLSKLSFSTLLAHRWEFQSDTYLDEKEQKFVNILKELYLS